MNKAERRALHIKRLKMIAKNPGITKTTLYLQTNPAVLRQGLKKSFGTDGWTVPDTLERNGFIERRVVKTRKVTRHGREHLQNIYGMFITVQGLNEISEFM